MHQHALFAATIAAAVASSAAAQDNTPHPSIPGFPGYELTDGRSTDFGEAEFQTGVKDDEAVTTKVEGRHWDLNYSIREGKKPASPIELMKNYQNAFEKKSGKLLHEAMDMSGGTAVLRMPSGKSETWMTLNVSNGGELYQLLIVERGGMEQKIELSADEMAQALAKDGKVALYGLLFDTGKDTIKAESTALLEEVKKLLSADAKLSLAIHGHTDDVGKKEANLKLSKRRAAAVKAWLVKSGIAAQRLGDEGFGDTKPVADNGTEEGKAKNRRVELVKR